MIEFSKEAFPYLEGKLFSNGFKFKCTSLLKKAESRLSYLERIVDGKTVIHIGFADHIPLIKDKIQKGLWLHKRLLTKASFCAGVDIDKKAVEYISRELEIPDLYAFDIVKDELPLQLRRPFDYMILGEVLEHIDNPVLFLKAIKDKYASFVKSIIITVPNAFAVENFFLALKHTEFVNTDHRFWFTPYTLAKVGTEAGLVVQGFEMCQTWRLDKWWKNLLINRKPLLRENLVMFFELPQ